MHNIYKNRQFFNLREIINLVLLNICEELRFNIAGYSIPPLQGFKVYGNSVPRGVAPGYSINPLR